MQLNTQNTGIIVQARLGSTRLPGKVLLPFYNGESILGILMGKLLKNEKGLKVVLATGRDKSNDELSLWAKNKDYICFRGSENDVLNRFIKCASAFGFDYIVRICADNPFLNTDLVDSLIEKANHLSGVDYLSFCNFEGIPAIKTHFGFFSELISLKSLKVAGARSNDPLDREHVTHYLYNHPDEFNISFIAMPEFLRFRKDIRLTIDSESDFLLARKIYSKVTETEDIEKIVQIIDSDDVIISAMKENISINSK